MGASNKGKDTTPWKTLKQIHDLVPPDYYDEGIRRNLFQRFWHGKRFAAVSSMIEPVSGQILDVGCNSCTFTAIVSRKSGASRTCGIDTSKSAIRYAIEKKEGFHLFLGDSEHLPFQDSSFDAIFCLEALEHMVEPDKALLEIRRCLKDEGYSIILVPIETFVFRFIWFFWTKFFKGAVWEGAHVTHLETDSLKRLVVDCGFKMSEDRKFLFGMMESIKIVKAA